jgi:bifunctional non-homologous end joining protein LigD
MSLQEYRRKRDFRRTAEPAKKGAASGPRRFVVQKHAAGRLHYDFRLELGGTLKSWAVPKGIPFVHGEKRLAVQVEDHPLAYGDFEGVIPKGEYGGGTVMVWDRGGFEPRSKSPLKELGEGKLHFTLHGRKLRGEWHLVRLREGDQWLLIRGGEDQKPPSKRQDDTSALSGKTMKQLARGDRGKKPLVAAKTKRAAAPALPGFVEPMKARLVAEAPAGDWMYEIKFDGWRALGLKGGARVGLLSRNKKDFCEKFPEITEALAELQAREAILDGEIVALDRRGRPSFQLLQAFDLGEKRPPIYFYVFDLLACDGRSLLSWPLEKRKARLKGLLAGVDGRIRLSEALGAEAAPLLAQVRKLGLEGLIGKKAGSRYQPGRRSGDWIKLKIQSEQEFVIGGFTEPSGSRKYFGSLIVGYYEGSKLLCAGRVGTGFDQKMLGSLFADFARIARRSCPFANLPDERPGRWGQGITAAGMKLCHWVKPVMVCQVKFSEWTRDGRLRQPVFLGLRKDKAARDVVKEEAA